MRKIKSTNECKRKIIGRKEFFSLAVIEKGSGEQSLRHEKKSMKGNKQTKFASVKENDTKRKTASHCVFHYRCMSFKNSTAMPQNAFYSASHILLCTLVKYSENVFSAKFTELPIEVH